LSLVSSLKSLRKIQFGMLEEAWNSEVFNLDTAIGKALDTADENELARLRVWRAASKTTLDAARCAEVARVEAAVCAEVAKRDAATRAKIATLEAAKNAKIATLEAAKKAEIALLEQATKAEIARLEAQRSADITAASLEAKLAERRKSEAYTNHEIKNRLVAIKALFESEETLETIKAMVEETLETIERKSVFNRLATGTYSLSPEQIDLSKLVEQRVLRFRPANRHVEVTPTKGDAKSCVALHLDPLLFGIIVDNLSSKKKQCLRSLNNRTLLLEEEE
jgi:signal transduction histidine kinase